MPGRRHSASVSVVMGSGSGTEWDYIRPGRLKPCVALPISAEEICLACSRAELTAVTIMSSSNWASAGLIACGSILIGGDGAVAFGHDFDRAAAAGGFDGASGQLGLDLFHLLLHSRSLFDNFSDAGHSYASES